MWKRALCIALALVLMLSLAACFGNNGGKNNATSSPAGSSTSGAATSAPVSEVPDLGSLIGGAGKLSDADAASRQGMIAAARREGGDLEFRSDGSAVFTDPEGNVTIQKPDGSWEYRNADGDSTSILFGGDWPDNEYTRLVPKPDFGITTSVTTDSEFSVLFVSAELDQIRTYVDQIKSSGFNVDAETEDMEMMGMVIFNFEAKNSAGYTVNVYSAYGISGLTVTK